MALEVNSLLHQRYKILEIIAKGGMGAIYRAIDESLGVEVAVKENLYTAEEATIQFHREATILASLRHANLPRVTDHFVIEGQGQYLVMDYVPGEDLRHRMRSVSKLTEEEAILIGMAICDALSYLHSRKPAIVHRDIKPGNIKITPDGQIFLVDFGLAKVAHVDQITHTGAQALTPGFAPPEQYGQGTDHRSDIYALGATLYAGLTQEIPEDGLARLTNNAQLTSLRHHNPDVSPSLAGAIQQAMRVNASERYQSAEEMKTALQAVDDNIHTQTQNTKEIRLSEKTTIIRAGQQTNPLATAEAVARTKPPKRRFPILPVVIGILILLAVVIVGGLTLLNRDTPPTVPVPPIAAVPTDTLTAVKPSKTEPVEQVMSTSPPTAVPSTAVPTMTFTPAATPIGGGGGQIAFASTRSDDIPQIWLMDANGGNKTQLTNLPDGACQPSWSPDGSRMVFTSPCRRRNLDIMKGSAMFIINIDGSGMIPLNSAPGGDFDPAWSPDGKSIAFTSIRDQIPHIFLYDLETNQVNNLSAPTSNDRRPAWSPDGKLIAFETTRLGSWQIWLMDPSGAEKAHEFTPKDSGYGRFAAWSPDGGTISYTKSSDFPYPAFKNFTAIDTPVSQHQISEIPTLLPSWNTDYSRDGYWVVFEHHDANDTDHNFDIYRAGTNGSRLERLTEDPGTDFDAAYSPAP
jgi:eukaryotic-like serine/threonine-protein kinase